MAAVWFSTTCHFLGRALTSHCWEDEISLELERLRVRAGPGDEGDVRRLKASMADPPTSVQALWASGHGHVGEHGAGYEMSSVTTSELLVGTG